MYISHSNIIHIKQILSNIFYAHPQGTILTVNLTKIILNFCGPGSSVGIATNYGLDGPGSNPGGDEIFRPSRPALGPSQPPVK